MFNALKNKQTFSYSGRRRLLQSLGTLCLSSPAMGPQDWRYPGRMLGQPLHKPTLLEDLQMTGKKQGTTLNWPWGQGQNSATGHKDTFWSNRGILKLDVMVVVCLIHLSKFIKCTPKSVNLTVSKLFHNKAVKTRISPGNSHLGITLCTCRTEKHTEACYVINAFSM